MFIDKELLYMKGHSHSSAFAFTVEPFSEDYTGRLSWHVLGNHLLRCASLHAGSHGFGYEYMLTDNRAWVLSRLVIELDEMPRTGEPYVIETWVSRIFRQFTDRHFAITDGQGRIYGYATSTWSLIDLGTRQPVDLTTLENGGFAEKLIANSEPPLQAPGRIRLKAAEEVGTRQARYSDLDINGHVNSIRYIDMMLDLFPKSLFDTAALKRIEVAYSLESYCDDVLSFYKEETTPGTTLVEIRKDGSLPVVKAAITFGS